jgi:type IV pilus assembly protein PilM
MARRLIGLDIGTNAVTIAEVTAGTPPRLDMFAQVALPRDAMREGEVADVAAVTDAVARLRNEVGLKKVPVRIGIASPRVVVRQVEMPVMTRDELMSALQFQAGDLIPIPIEDAVLDFAILGTTQPSGEGATEPTMQVLLVAAYESAITKLVSAIEAGGLEVGAVDLIPLALTRALARPIPAMATVGADGAPVAAGGIGAEGIVSFGGGVTAISVHENGVPQFVRVLGTGGRELTDAIATDLGVPPETAEALKRALANPQPDEMVARARTAVDRPLSVLLDDVRSSIDYYRNQAGSAQLRRVVVTGGSAQLPGLPERLSALVGVPVEPAYMHDLLRIGDIGFAPDELPRLEPYLPAPVGLALGGANVGTVIDLRPRSRGKAAKAGRGAGIDRRFVAAGLAGIVLLGGLTYLAKSSESSAQSRSNKAQAEAKKLRSQLYYEQQGPQTGGTSAAALKAEVTSVFAQDVNWPTILGDLGTKLPPGIRFDTFAGTHNVDTPPPAAATAPAATTGTTGSTGSSSTGSSGATGTSGTSGAAASTAPAAPTATNICAAVTDPQGTVSISGTAPSVPAVAALIDTLQKDTDLSVVWVTTAKLDGEVSLGTHQQVIDFTVTANLGHTARGHRLESFFKEAKCK